MYVIKKCIQAIGMILIIISQSSCIIISGEFVELRNGNIRAPNGIEYTFFSHEGFIQTIGESKFLGKIKWEYPYLHHLGGSINTGLYSTDLSNLDIIFRYKPKNEWKTYYRKTSLPKIELAPENCIRFVFIGNTELIHYENNRSVENKHITNNAGIINPEEIKEFINCIRNEYSPEEAGLYEMVTNEKGIIENTYAIGYVFGFFDNESNFAISYRVWSYNNLAYSIHTDFGRYVLSIKWLEKLEYKND